MTSSGTALQCTRSRDWQVQPYGRYPPLLPITLHLVPAYPSHAQQCVWLRGMHPLPTSPDIAEAWVATLSALLAPMCACWCWCCVQCAVRIPF